MASTKASTRPITIPRPYSEWLIYFQLERNYIHQTKTDSSNPTLYPITKTKKPGIKLFDPEDASYLSLFARHTHGPPLALPERYQELSLPDKFYTIYKDGMEKRVLDERRKLEDGIIKLRDLSEMVSKNWESADDETKEYVRVMNHIEVGEYQRRYDESCISASKKKEEAARAEQAEEQTRNELAEEIKKGINAKTRAQQHHITHVKIGGSSKSKTLYSEMINQSNDAINININRGCSKDKSSDGLVGKRQTYREYISSCLPVKKRQKWTCEQQSHPSNSNDGTDGNKDSSVAAAASSRSPNNSIETFNAITTTGNQKGKNESSIAHQDLSLLACAVMEQTYMPSLSRTYRAASASAGVTHMMTNNAKNNNMMNDSNHDKIEDATNQETTRRNHSNKNDPDTNDLQQQQRQRQRIQEQLRQQHSQNYNGEAFYTPLIEQYNNQRDVAYPQALLAKYHGAGRFISSVESPTRRNSGAGAGVGSVAAVGQTSHSTRTGASGVVSHHPNGISNPNQQQVGSHDENNSHDAVKQILEEMKLTHEEIWLLLERGAKSIAQDAARFVTGEVDRPCPASTKAAIKYLEAQSRTPGHVHSVEDGTTMARGNNPSSSGSQQGTLSVDAGSNIATIAMADTTTRGNAPVPQAGTTRSVEASEHILTIAAAATAAGVRLYQPNRGSKEEESSSVGHGHNANNMDADDLLSTRTVTSPDIFLPPSIVNSRGSKEEITIGRHHRANNNNNTSSIHQRTIPDIQLSTPSSLSNGNSPGSEENGSYSQNNNSYASGQTTAITTDPMLTATPRMSPFSARTFETTLQSESSREENSAFHLQQNLLNNYDIIRKKMQTMKNNQHQQLAAIVDAKIRADFGGGNNPLKNYWKTVGRTPNHPDYSSGLDARSVASSRKIEPNDAMTPFLWHQLKLHQNKK